MRNPYSIVRWLFAIALVSFFSVQGCISKLHLENKDDSKALLFARQHLPLSGILVQNADGYAYLKVDDRYIHELYKRLDVAKNGFAKPPYFRRKNAPGAHISVIYKNERTRLKEVGQSFDFRLVDIKEVSPDKRTRYLVIEVYAPKLEKLRQKYGLSSKLNGHEFHITVAKKVLGKS